MAMAFSSKPFAMTAFAMHVVGPGGLAVFAPSRLSASWLPSVYALCVCSQNVNVGYQDEKCVFVGGASE